MTKIEIVKSDITKVPVDAIVNAANKSLLGGAGVDGAIHRVAGNELLEECKLLGGCEIGEAKVTNAYRLPSKIVIHTVGPIWRGGSNKEEEYLENCYRNSIELARANDCKSISFPAISTGVYSFPLKRATEIAFKTVRTSVQKSALEKVVFVCFDDTTFKTYLSVQNDSTHINKHKESEGFIFLQKAKNYLFTKLLNLFKN